MKVSKPKACKRADKRKAEEDLYIGLIQEAYKANASVIHSTLHDSRSGRFVHVDPLDVPVHKAVYRIFSRNIARNFTPRLIYMI